MHGRDVDGDRPGIVLGEGEDGPSPARSPPLVVLPGMMIIMLDPMLLIWSAIRCSAPDPMATVAITAPTPMMMPSMVRAARSLFTRRARRAMRTAGRIFRIM